MDLTYCDILDNQEITDSIYKIRLKSDDIANHAKPGQFVMIKPGENFDIYLNRPLGIADVDREKHSFELIYKIVGKGTRIMSRLETGAAIGVIGPLGNGFPLPAQAGKQLLAAGGIGYAPLLFLAKTLCEKGNDLDIIIGGKTKGQISGIKEFSSLGADVHITTEDGTMGEKGFPTLPLSRLLAEASYKTVYVCGPTAMMKAIGDLCCAQQVKCYVSLEERMGCGYGVCMGCTCKVNDASGTGLRRVCLDGPVFLADEVVWHG